MVHALTEAHRVLKPKGLLIDMRPAAKHRRAGLGEGNRWQLVGTMREKFDDDIASDRAVRQVVREKLFHREFQIEFDLERVMDTLAERDLEKEPIGTKITVRGPLKIGVMRKLGQ